MINILFNYNGDIAELKAQTFIKLVDEITIYDDGNEVTTQKEIEFKPNFTAVSEMLEGTLMTVFDYADDFDICDDWMSLNGTCEVIGGFGEDDYYITVDGKPILVKTALGKQYNAKKEKNKYNKTKYKKWLKDRYVLDENGEPTNVKLPKGDWHCNNYMGWENRDLENA